ncbi:hypothetical protein D5018_16595 [Parashewanella curva]|uniref:Uncharacterized protein n=1 Tax=Parashewanella curva TaxID=2338552 RepID=A0A3L8PVV8_9GAMM|nr:hypothetical protein [Parashewanella curva]RLV58558.1 hypothetical protein D5018_16595 [Parashewanella curva]
MENRFFYALHLYIVDIEQTVKAANFKSVKEPVTDVRPKHWGWVSYRNDRCSSRSSVNNSYLSDMPCSQILEAGTMKIMEMKS